MLDRPVDGTATSKLKQVSLKKQETTVHHHYETCQPHFPSQIREQIGGNESCILIGDEEESQHKCILGNIDFELYIEMF